MMSLKKIHDFYIDNSYTKDKEMYIKAKLLLNSYLVVVLFAFSYTFISILIDFSVGLYTTLVLGFAYLLFPFILRYPNKLSVLGHFFMVTASSSSIILIYYSGGLFSAVTPWLAITPVMALLILNRTSAWFWTIVMILSVFCFAVPQYQGFNFEYDFNKDWIIPFDAMALSGFILVVFLCNLIFETEKNKAMQVVELQNHALHEKQNEITASNEELSQQKEELASIVELVKDKNRFIEKQNEEVRASITYASRIQTALLPYENRLKEYFNQQIFTIYQPRDIVSGDFYWCEKIDDTIILAVADCTGHGVPGAFMSMLGSTGLNHVVFQENILEADKILAELHNYIFKALRQDEAQSADGMDMALVVIHKNSQMMEFAGAMNPLYYLQDNQLTQVNADAKPIGGGQYGRMREFTKHIIDISKPTTVYLASDGYQDQFGGKDGRKFMKKRFRELLTAISTLSLHEQKTTLESTLQEWMDVGQEKQIDDVLVVGFKTT